MSYHKFKDIVDTASYIDGGGIFACLNENETTYLNSIIAKRLDTYFLLNHSGKKWVTELLGDMYEDNDCEVLTSTQLHMIANIIWAMNKDRWAHLAKYYNVTYNPIENYSMVEVETPDITEETTIMNDSTVSTKNKQTTTDNTHAFNSDTAVPTNGSTTEGSDTDNVTTTDEDVTNTKTETGTRTLERSGNIGVTTTAQMLEGDSAFWSHWNFYKKLMDDIDDVVTLAVY